MSIPAQAQRDAVNPVDTPCVLDVALVAIWRRTGPTIRVLVTRRPAGVHLEGRWELPGGKVALGELPAAAAARELREETGISVDPATLAFLATVEHEYSDRTVRLHAFEGEAPPDSRATRCEEADNRWVAASELTSLDFPAANDAITRALIAALNAKTPPPSPALP